MMTRMTNTATTNPPIEPTISASGGGWTVSGTGVIEALTVGITNTKVVFRNGSTDVVRGMT